MNVNVLRRWGNAASPDESHGVPVLVVRCPHGYFISFGADVDHRAADLVVAVAEGLSDQAQELARNMAFT